jgi:exopolysaccharide biosynthesis polyprenyl glycosylphosphotransferase
MSTITSPVTPPPAADLLALADPRTLEVVRARRQGERLRRRGWLVRRALLAADLSALIVAFAAAEFASAGPATTSEWTALLALLPVWVLMAKIYGLYDRDEERADHSTVDDITGIFHLVTVGVWLLLVTSRITGAAHPDLMKLAVFWVLAIVFIATARTAARAAARRSVLYVQNLVVLGAGDVGQLVARKVLQHPEYGINVVGFVDDHPRRRRPALEDVAVLGPPSRLREIVGAFDVDRVVVAFSQEPERETVALIRSLRDLDVQVDVVPRLFDVIGPRVTHHTLEALPMTGLLPVRLSRSSRAVKRLVDVVGAATALLLTAPLFAVIAVLIRIDSPGPVLFRQTRVGLGMREFTVLKFRTMRVGCDDAVHRDYIRSTMSSEASAEANGHYKLERKDAVTAVGSWLRRTSLDELPQLINVLRGDMSLVGPRPCIPYETECFLPHHFERFLVPPGITGLWQVTARACTTFGEALDMDVAYARGCSFGLDMRLLCATPHQVLRRRGAS